MWMITSLTKTLSTIFFPSYCYLCHNEGASLCTSCLKERKRSYDTPYPWISSIYSFKDPSIKKIIHAIKYFHRKDLVAPLVEALIEEINQSHKHNHVLVPVPMPKLRKYIRGYNQAEAIATELSKQTRIPIRSDILNRLSSPARQVKTKNRNDRLKNQHNAFSTQKDISGLQIILIDDVTTTGATLLEARHVLLQNGATSVEAYTLAH